MHDTSPNRACAMILALLLVLTACTGEGSPIASSGADGAKGNSDVDLVIGADGTVYFLTMGFDRSLAEGTHVTVGVSHDVGATWERTYLSDTRGDDRPWIGVAPDGTAHAVWNDGSRVSHAVSTDAGRTWAERGRVHGRGGSSHLAVGPNGEVAVRITPISASGRQFDPAGEYVPVIFLSDGGLAVVTPVQDHRNSRFGFSFRRFSIP